jgi:ABC-type Mn2+/Zn2+ transport system permease subunit
MEYKGLLGALLLAIGGTILFLLYYVFFQMGYSHVYYPGIPAIDPVLIIFSFLGFFVFGIGLWLIVQSGKAETRQNPS